MNHHQYSLTVRCAVDMHWMTVVGEVHKIILVVDQNGQLVGIEGRG